MVLPSGYAVCGTKLAYGGTRLLRGVRKVRLTLQYEVSAPPSPYARNTRCPYGDSICCFALCGTEIANAATRRWAPASSLA
eukprot:2170616-Rhodomonas_salina.1